MRSQTIHPATAALPRLIALGAALLGSVAVAPKVHAQQGQPQVQEDRQRRGGDPEERLNRRVSRMTDELKLTTAQAAKVRQILSQEQTEMRALWEKNRPQGDANSGARDANRDAVRAQMKAIHDRTEKQIDGVLTAQQRATYAQLREAHKKDHEGREGREGRRPRDQQPPAGR